MTSILENPRNVKGVYWLPFKCLQMWDRENHVIKFHNSLLSKIHNALGSSWSVCNILWLKFINYHVDHLNMFLPCQKQLYSQRPDLVHVSLNNELLFTPPLSSFFIYLFSVSVYSVAHCHQKQSGSDIGR